MMINFKIFGIVLYVHCTVCNCCLSLYLNIGELR